MIERVSKHFYEHGIKAVENGRCKRCNSFNTKMDFRGVEYCLDCYTFKEINSSHYLIRRMRTFKKVVHELELGFELSESQNRGSNFLLMNFTEGKDSFLHAVCGAGKTEMVLKVILEALNKNLSVAFVIPRVEIIKQVYIRISLYLPNTKVSYLYGGANLDESFHLLVTTPQQLIKFYQEFDLLIIDEIDAFPFVDNPFLERLIDKAKKDKARFIYMSATLSKKYEQKIEKKELEYHLIPRRFHKKDLCVPLFVQADDFKSERIIKYITTLIDNNKGLIIYLPSINKGKVFKDYLEGLKINCGLISSETKYKAIVLKDFINGNFKVLISTTILERGVTFNNVNVIVIETDNKVYNEATLIQIAGRVGRSGDDGMVVFFAREKSSAMIKARNKIIEFNRR
ncbi:MAG TPA: helicase-related protein [Bacillota bacterium]|nr:helicase-related protein [Bacillota bacterium]